MGILRIEDLPEHDDVVTREFIHQGDDKANQFCALRHEDMVFFLTANDGSITSRDLIKFTSTASGKGWKISSNKTVKADSALIAQLNVGSYKNGLNSESLGSVPQTEVEDMFDDICKVALTRGASDIFIEFRPDSEKENQVKMRINGLIESVRSLPSEMTGSLVAVSYNSISESGSKTSDNTAFIRTAVLNSAINRTIDAHRVRLRAVYMPAFKDGTDLILRVLPEETDEVIPTISELGYASKHVELISRMAAKTTGVLIFCGIAGSGKSTTIRSLLDGLSKKYPGKRIAMIEDPIEHEIKGVNQIPIADIRTKDGKNPWTEAVRGLVRSNVDIMALGEIRDNVTASECVDYILSGHQVLTTLHSSSAIGCAQRLERLGIGRDIIAGPEFISGFVYQRLLPKLCPDCSAVTSIQHFIDADLRNRLSKIVDASMDIIKIRGAGCDHPECHKGYIGRVVTAETMLLDNKMRDFIREGKDTEALSHWRAHGTKGGIGHGTTALEHARYLMRKGLVSPLDVEAAFGYLDMQDIESDGVIDQSEV